MLNAAKHLAFAAATGTSFLVAGCVVIPYELPPNQQVALRDRAIEAVKRAVRYPHAGSVRAQGIEILQRHLAEYAFPWIRLALNDEEPGVRFAAVLALGKLGDMQSYQNIRRFADDQNPSLRIAAYFALHRLGDTSYAPRLPDLLLHSPSPEVRRDAAFVLGLLGERGAVTLLAKAMKDADESVRDQALESMALLKHPQAVQQLTFWASSGPGTRRVTALNTLAELEMPSLEDTFKYKLRDGEFLETRLAAARGLGKLNNGDGFTLSLWALNFHRPQKDAPQDPPKDQIMRVRQLAATALGAIRDGRALAALRRRLNDPSDPRVQLAVADAILEILGAQSPAYPPWRGRHAQSIAGGKP